MRRSAVGSTVTWTNGDDESHTVTNDLRMFDQEIWPGESWSYTSHGAGRVLLLLPAARLDDRRDHGGVAQLTPPPDGGGLGRG